MEGLITAYTAMCTALCTILLAASIGIKLLDIAYDMFYISKGLKRKEIRSAWKFMLSSPLRTYRNGRYVYKKTIEVGKIKDLEDVGI